MKLWQKKYDTNKRVEQFTVGSDRIMDKRLARFDILGSMAHTAMLSSIGLITCEEAKVLHNEMKNILSQIDNDNFIISPSAEDIHSHIEYVLSKNLGDVGKKIHSGRSRNDQVLVDLKLYMRHELKEIVYAVKELFDMLVELSEKNKDILMPGYTHLQAAMPSSFGLWFGAYAESLVDDIEHLLAAYKVCNKNPLGSAAGYGSSFHLDRDMTTSLLGFKTLNYNTINAQMGRGKSERFVAIAIASLAYTLSRLAGDNCLFMCQNFAFVSYPDSYTTGSSIMPHKKNPDVWELIRGRCNALQALPTTISTLTTNLPLGYNRDLQLLKEYVFPAITHIKDLLSMTTEMISMIDVKKDILNDSKYDYIFSVNAVNELVKQGVPFREAYRTLSDSIVDGTYKPNKTETYTHKGSIGNLCNRYITLEMESALELFDFDTVEKAEQNLIDGKHIKENK